MKNYIPVLTPLRGIAALCVVFFHARLILFTQWKDPLSEYTQFIENGYLWVDLFFLLSGFVMMHIYHKTFSQGISLMKWRQFMWLRFSRIYPLFLVTLLVLVLWETIKHFSAIGFYGGPLFESWGVSGIPAFEGPFNRSDTLLANFMMLHAVIHKDLSWNISSWSLSVEWLCYMVFPLLVPLISSRFRNTLWLPLIAFIGLMGINSTHGSLDITGDLFAFVRGLCSFAMGAWMRNIVVSQAMKKWLNNDVSLLGIFLVCLWLLHLPREGNHNVVVVVMFAVLVFIAAHQSERNTPVFKLMDNRVTRFLGDISYSVYLWHVVLLLPAIEIMNLLNPDLLGLWLSQTSWFAGLLGAIVFLLLTVVVSAFSYYYLERPAMSYLRNKLRNRQLSVSASS